MAETKPISRLKVLQDVLSQTRDVICEAYGLNKEEAFNKTQAFIEENSEHWRLPEPNINYHDPFCRMAYLYMNVTVHATLVEKALSSYAAFKKLIKEKINTSSDLHICALGGGPGSELIGTVRYIQRLNLKSETVHLDFALIDRIREWDESWHTLKSGVDSQLRGEYGPDRSKWPVSVSRSFLPLDATRASEFNNFATRFSDTDIFFLCYLVSELKGSINKLERVITSLVKKTSTDALILFIDRDERAIRENVQRIINHNPHLIEVETIREKGGIEDDLEDLGEWYINLPTLPRRKWMAFFTLAQIKVVR